MMIDYDELFCKCTRIRMVCLTKLFTTLFQQNCRIYVYRSDYREYKSYEADSFWVLFMTLKGMCWACSSYWSAYYLQVILVGISEKKLINLKMPQIRLWKGGKKSKNSTT